MVCLVAWHTPDLLGRGLVLSGITSEVAASKTAVLEAFNGHQHGYAPSTNCKPWGTFLNYCWLLCYTN